MTEEKIRTEMEKRFIRVRDSLKEGDHSAFYTLKDILSFIDSMQEEPVNENLEGLINELNKRYPEVSFAKLSRIAVTVSNWQKQQTIDKACKWIMENCNDYNEKVETIFGKIKIINSKEMVKDFRKVMEE